MNKITDINKELIGSTDKAVKEHFQDSANSVLKMLDSWRAYARVSHPEESAAVEEILKDDAAEIQVLMEIGVLGDVSLSAFVKAPDGSQTTLVILDGKT